jgi:hypothetical protein
LVSRRTAKKEVITKGGLCAVQRNREQNPSCVSNKKKAKGSNFIQKATWVGEE